MGGTAYLVYGNIDPVLLEKREIKPTFLQKIFGKKNFIQPKEMKVDDNRTIIDINQPELNNLVDLFQGFIKKTLPKYNSATQQFIEYLDIKIMSIFIRGERFKDKTEWYIQFGFSGCAGMAEVSAELGSHWVNKWIAIEKNNLLNIFAKNGFQMFDNQNSNDESYFIPFEKYGYAKIQNTEIMDEEYEGSKYFEFDQSCLEGLDENDYSKMKNLDKNYKKYYDSKKCCCQICNPEFVPLKI